MLFLFGIAAFYLLCSVKEEFWVYDIFQILSILAVIVGICIFDLCIKNAKVILLIDTNGITYGHRFFSWKDLEYLYARKGLNLKFEPVIQISYKNRFPVQNSSMLIVDNGLTVAEYNNLCKIIEENVCPKFPHFYILPLLRESKRVIP